MVRKIISRIVLFVILGLLSACSPDISVTSSKPSGIPFNTTSIPSVVQTYTPSETDSVVQAEPNQTPGMPQNDNITGMRGAVNIDVPRKILTNQSVNYAWGGKMCEAGGYIYYVSDGGRGQDSTPVYIARMSTDESQGIPVTSNYARIYGLTADDKYLYYLAFETNGRSSGELYALPISGGNERKIRDLGYSCPQAMGGRIYWDDSNPYSRSNVVNIMSMNPDGTDMKQLLSIPVSELARFYFLATPNGLYYVCPTSPENDDCSIFHTDLEGQNKVQLNKEGLGMVDMLFYDQNNLYFISLNLKGHMSSAVNRLDENGQKSVIIKSIDYFPQDEAINYFCGVSQNSFYYFTSNPEGMDLHSYDMNHKTDRIIANELDNPQVLHSLRGKTIDVQSVYGFYILGNDIFYGIYVI